MNLLDPGKTPHENAQFLLFLTAVIKAVDEYQDLLRVSVASAGNDHRLGANEAPPAVVSMFLGTELTEILEAIESGSAYNGCGKMEMEIGVDVLPRFPKDTTDRNRTSPFAFTGNKFEFRMLGSTLSISGPNIVLNTIVAEALEQFADLLEKADDFTGALNSLIKETIKNHKRIIFNGNGYDDAWIQEAEKRGLLNLHSSAEALPYFCHEKNIQLFTKHHIFTEAEIRSRCEIMLENYCKVISIEALTMLEMVRKDIMPAVCSYRKHLSETALATRELCPDLTCESEIKLISRLTSLCNSLSTKTDNLEKAVIDAKTHTEAEDSATYHRDYVFGAMQELRAVADEIEGLVGETYWPYPTYGAMIFSVR